LAKIMTFVILISVLGFFLMFHRRKLNLIILTIVLGYLAASVQRLANLEDSRDLIPIIISVGGLFLIWLGTWFGNRYITKRRDRARLESQVPPARPRIT
jgi:hypothetical protein